MRHRAAIAALTLVVLGASMMDATTIILPTDEQLIAKSPVIVTGLVLESQAVDQQGAIFTMTRVAVDRVLKGSAPSIVILREVGGRVGDRFNVVFGSPEYSAGERVLLFLWPTERGDFQTRDLLVGKFTERHTVEGERLWFREEQLFGTHLLDGRLQPVEVRNIQRLADRFTHYVSERAAGRGATRDYEVLDPVLAREPRIHPNFTLIDEPSIYRWFAFDNSGSATWYSVGTQPGFGNGGVSEATAAMNSWNAAQGARIRMTYGGVAGASTGLSSPNGRNEILFNDPGSEINGSYSPSTGGVVGRGGFNNVQNGGSWTSGFAADSAHPAATYSNTGNIVEGNLVIQDGITGTNFSSTLLAAVLAHELGHALGFGHSADPNALMYASLRSGVTAALASDDLNAARWLYPAAPGGSPGNPPPPPPPPPSGSIPAAPSNLTATVVNGSQIQLTWTVNATNATSQPVYVAEGQGGFAYVGDVAASRNSALLSSVSPGMTYRIRVTAKNSAGESEPSNTATATVPIVTTNPTILALGSARFRLTLEARDPRTGRNGVGLPIPQNDLFGYFSIPDLTSDPNNPEVFVKMLDGGAVNGKFWVFWGGLTDLEYTVRVTDMTSGLTRSYLKEGGSSCGGFDTAAFSASAEAPLEEAYAPGSLDAIELTELDDLSADACATGGGNLCTLAGRFRITLSARDQRTGTTASGQALPQNDLFGYFSIPGLTGNAANPEVFVKVLDGRSVNGKFWVFYGGLTDLEYGLTVTDTQTGAVRTYQKAAGSSCGGFDTAAF